MTESWPTESWDLDKAVENAKRRRAAKRRIPKIHKKPGTRRFLSKDIPDDDEIYCANERPSRVIPLEKALVPYQFAPRCDSYYGPSAANEGRMSLGAKRAEIRARFHEDHPNLPERRRLGDEIVYLEGPALVEASSLTWAEQIESESPADH